MTPGQDRSRCDNLEQLQHAIDGCRARDIPALRKQLAVLQRRCRRNQPVDRGIGALADAVEQSLQHVDQRRRQAPRPQYPLSLPVVDARESILALIDSHQVVVLCGETGSGKTTQLPKLCLELGRGTRGRIGHTQPRRIAARSLAARIAEELQSPLGATVGYKVRFQDHVHDSTYVKVMTDGILLAEIQSDPELREYDTLILDEAHERSLNIDFLLGYLHQLLPQRPDLKLIITSATIDPQRFADHFGGAPVIEVSGRLYPMEMRYRPLQGEDEDQQDRSREQALLEAVDELAAEGPGDVLVFLPGERAIRDTSELLRKHHPPHTGILPLYARLSPAEQGQVFRPHTGRRIVLATNVAETSLTVPGIRYVVDTGLARISRYNYRTKIQRLPIEPVSQASANQRAGRCGRVAAGVCIRLYSEDDFLARSQYTEPEIQRTNLAAVILQMATLGLGKIEHFPFVDAPDSRLVADGYKLLYELQAVDEGQRLTPLGRHIARLPVDPRLARMIFAARDLGCLAEVLVIASALEVNDPRERPLDKAQAADEKHALFRDPQSDFLSYLNLWNAFREQSQHLSQNKLRKWCREHFVSYLRMREWTDVRAQLLAQVRAMGMSCNTGEADYRSIHCALLSGLPGNIAFQVEAGEYLGARNLKFALFPGSGLAKKKPKWLVAGELVETGKRYLRTAAAIDPAWVEPLAQHLIKRSYSEPHWEKKRAQVVAFERLTLYGLPLVQRRKVNYGPIDPIAARELFIRHALVPGEFGTRAVFVEHNRRLLAELEALESKSRRRDLLVDEEALYRFFDERIPASVYDGPHFERWWKEAQRGKPDLLHLQRDSIMRHAADDITAEQYPDHMELRGLSLPLAYRFEPGTGTDGLCVQVPLAALNQLCAEDFEWLVPGLLQEKITLLIKSLPKQLRRHFVPAPDYASAVMQALEPRRGALIDAVAEQLQRITGIAVPKQAWRPELLPEYLFANFELLDEQGKVIGSGRDLQQLQAGFAGHVQHRLARLADPRYERSDVQDWDFGTLPEIVELEHAGVSLRAWPALAVDGDRIELRLFDTAQEARRAHREGLLALFRKKAGRSVKEIRRAIPELAKQSLWFSTLSGADILQADLERAVLQAAFAVDATGVRDAATFAGQLRSGQQRLVELAQDIGGWSFDALQAWQELNRLLKGAVSPAMISAINEVRDQVEQLVYPGFIAATPLRWLPHLGRFIRAAVQRLEKLPADPQRDRKLAAVIAQHLQQYQRAARERPPDDEALVEYRWMIEELRVSMFAQGLGTSAKVSPERLDRQWKSLL